MYRKEVGKSDNKHNGRILDINYIIVSDLRHNIAKCLRQNNIQHGLPVIHADCLGSLKLAGIDTHDAAAYRFRHIGACVDRHDKDADCPYAWKCDVEENDDIAMEYGVRSVPTILFFKNGQLVDKFVGAAKKSDFDEKFKALL